MNRVKAPGVLLAHARMRFGAFLLAVVVALAMSFGSPLSAYASELGIGIDKTAGALNEDKQSEVNLRFTGETDQTYSDVVFVLDKSVSTDVRNDACNMLDELLKQAGNNKIKVGVVVFNREIYVNSGLTELNDSTYEEIKTALFSETSSGTNVYAGLMAGKEMLDNDSDVSDSAKHLVLVTDGVTYLWSDDSGTVSSIYSEQIANMCECLYAGNDDENIMKAHHPDLDAYIGEFSNMRTWLNNHSSYAQDITSYQHEYVGGMIEPDVMGQGMNSTYNNSGFDEDDYVSGENREGHACANDAAVYKAAKAWESIVNAGYKAYAFAEQDYAEQYPWGPDWVESLDTIGGTSGAVPSDTTGLFDAVKSDVLYELGAGSTITDVMGSGTTKYGEPYNFDFVNDINKINVTVDGIPLDKTSYSENSYSFIKNGSSFLTLAYNPDTDAITVDIQQPVAGNDVAISYYVELVTAPTVAGDYKLNTNNSAVLDPAGNFEDKTFPVPTVTYTVEEAPVSPATPDDGNNNTNSNTQVVTVNSDTPDAGEGLPKTGDSVLPFAIAFLAVIALAGATGVVAWRKSH